MHFDSVNENIEGDINLHHHLGICLNTFHVIRYASFRFMDLYQSFFIHFILIVTIVRVQRTKNWIYVVIKLVTDVDAKNDPNIFFSISNALRIFFFVGQYCFRSVGNSPNESSSLLFFSILCVVWQFKFQVSRKLLT